MSKNKFQNPKNTLSKEARKALASVVSTFIADEVKVVEPNNFPPKTRKENTTTLGQIANGVGDFKGKTLEEKQAATAEILANSSSQDKLHYLWMTDLLIGDSMEIYKQILQSTPAKDMTKENFVAVIKDGADLSAKELKDLDKGILPKDEQLTFIEQRLRNADKGVLKGFVDMLSPQQAVACNNSLKSLGADLSDSLNGNLSAGPSKPELLESLNSKIAEGQKTLDQEARKNLRKGFRSEKTQSGENQTDVKKMEEKEQNDKKDPQLHYDREAIQNLKPTKELPKLPSTNATDLPDVKHGDDKSEGR